MKYGYLLDDSFIEAPKHFIKIDGASVFNPKEEHFKAAGYTPLIESKKPDDGNEYRDVYSMNNDSTAILQSWVKIPKLEDPTIDYIVS